MYAENQLVGHPSPYLALHGGDPVDWQDWNQDTVNKARQEGKLLFLSSGYFSCHWCHVMQRESYQDPAIADLLNRDFISVKIDRELEPALDERLIEFAEQTLGRAGWPLNVFITPDGYPVFAVLYMPPGQFTQVLNRLTELWATQRVRLQELARRVADVQYPPAMDSIDSATVNALMQQFVEQSLAFHDDFQGGFGNQNKFPHAPELSQLLDIYRDNGDERLHDLLESTLDAMAQEGMWDHVGGGFYRYVVDPGWQVPHYEKMLYDNAMLADVYRKASNVFDNSYYATIARQTLDFMADEMIAAEGALISSFSAVDDKDVEGGYYIWSHQELEALLEPDPYRILRIRCGVSGVPEGDGHHLRCSNTLSHVARNMGIEESRAMAMLNEALSKLKQYRGGRVLPADTKLLAGWNGLALSAFSQAAVQWDDQRYRDTATSIRNYLVNILWDGKRLSRAKHDGTALGNAALEDYAFVAEGLWHYAELTDASEDYALALAITNAGYLQFNENHNWRRQIDGLLAPAPAVDITTDSPLPSPTAVMGRLFHVLSVHYQDQDLKQRATTILNRSYERLAENAFFYSSHITALQALAESDSR